MKTVAYDALEYAERLCENDSGGHDPGHIERVFRTAVRLAVEEHADVTVCALAAALHDADDRKLSPETYENKDNARLFLKNSGMSDGMIETVVKIIGEVSFRGSDSVVPESLEGKIVQDADRLDAIGAVGIARCFAFGGSKGRKIYDRTEKPVMLSDGKTYCSLNSCSINHFYEKLLFLRDMMNTSSARREAEKRHDYMCGFLREFYNEIGEDAPDFLSAE